MSYATLFPGKITFIKNILTFFFLLYVVVCRIAASMKLNSMRSGVNLGTQNTVIIGYNYCWKFEDDKLYKLYGYCPDNNNIVSIDASVWEVVEPCISTFFAFCLFKIWHYFCMFYLNHIYLRQDGNYISLVLSPHLKKWASNAFLWHCTTENTTERTNERTAKKRRM